MKKLFTLATLVATFGFFTLCFAAPTHVSGYVMDAKCSTNKAMTHPGAKTSECAVTCVKGGSPAVLVERSGEVLQIANQDKVTDAVGHNARLTGTIDNGTITVTEVHVYKSRTRRHHTASK
ncbi:MAG: hypothetical protein EPN33_02330 [Acidobacteria bacterium]|nr:MAG: hypothetical protein EPN33_02330 [Acidobacteriota bacterium]